MCLFLYVLPKKNSITSKMHVIYGIFLNLKVWQVIFIPVARILDFFFFIQAIKMLGIK